MAVSAAFVFLGVCFLFNGVQSDIKSPYTRDESPVPSIDIGVDHAHNERHELDELRRNFSEISRTFYDYKITVEREFHNLYELLDSRHPHNIHNTDPHSTHDNVLNPEECQDEPQEIPKFPPRLRNPEDFDLAVCTIQPNSKTPSNVTGRVVLLQKKNTPTVYMILALKGFDPTGARSQPVNAKPLDHEPHFRPGVGPRVPQETITLDQLSTHGYSLHGFHVHERADFSDGCDSTGGHYNPFYSKHGAPESVTRHLGDFGNIESDANGNVFLTIIDEKVSLRGQYNIVGKPLVVHADVDDLGRYPNNRGSTSTGNAGARLGCGLIEKIPSSLYNNYHFASEQTERHTATDDQARSTKKL